jgi:hypothetical protein
MSSGSLTDAVKPWRIAASRAVSPEAVHTFDSVTPGSDLRIGISMPPAKLPAPMKPTLAAERAALTPNVAIMRGGGGASSGYCSTTPRNRSWIVPATRSYARSAWSSGTRWVISFATDTCLVSSARRNACRLRFSVHRT